MGGIAALEKYVGEIPKPLVEDPPGIVWIGAAGDLMLGRGAEEILFREGPRGIFGGAADLLASSDLALVNLEGAVSSRGGGGAFCPPGFCGENAGLPGAVCPEV
ncbi:MAG: CapA family protein [Spirochaetaceae bacterium]|nr:CapA family protein [Spirochaetaceae bacterium]